MSTAAAKWTRLIEEVCGDWNPDVTYTICENSCNEDQFACHGIAKNAESSAQVYIGTGSCNGKHACKGVVSYNSDIGKDTSGTGHSGNIRIGDIACNGINACKNMAVFRPAYIRLWQRSLLYHHDCAAKLRFFICPGRA